MIYEHSILIVYIHEDSKHSPSKSLEDILSTDKISLQDDQTTKTSPQTNKLDKASILRDTACYLRKHHDELIIETNISSSRSRTTTDEITDMVKFSWKPPSNIVMSEEWIQTTSMNCLFPVAKSDPYNTQILYVSNHISSLLDYSQKKLTNRSVFELILPQEHDQLRDYFLKDHRFLEKYDVPWRRATTNQYEQFNKEKQENNEKYFMSIVKVNTLDRTIIVNNRNLINQFTLRINLHERFIHIDSKARKFLGYNSSELIGHTHFDFVHPDDLPIIVRAHRICSLDEMHRNETYRTSIREKLSEHRIRKQAEIRVGEEIKVIEDIIKFINEFELKRSKTLSSKPINSSTSLHLTGDITSSSQLSQRTQQDHPSVRSSNDETIFDQLTNSLFSSQQETFSLSSPLTSFATVSSSLLIPPIRLSLSPIRATTTITNTDMISTEKSSRKPSLNHSLPPNSFVS
ncbi:unnamed protein product [Rotaria magnacalcarata]|uniref:PAS domain-containing protein n=2 Tax=Rotaria magnacalcarata TaxID=392030 RepID=A0A819D6U6_9BILA|nr:unnamed protein product [Rotaria magnacalcarata]CAF3818769.1 unnamed protein product [Rotaria magnacalcarata]